MKIDKYSFLLVSELFLEFAWKSLRGIHLSKFIAIFDDFLIILVVGIILKKM
jgi:hypothetical protein